MGNAEPSRPVLEALLVTGAAAGAATGGTIVAVTGAVTGGACWSREPSREPSRPVDGAPLAPTLPPDPLRWALSLSTSESTGVPALACAELERANESAGVPALACAELERANESAGVPALVRVRVRVRFS